MSIKLNILYKYNYDKCTYRLIYIREKKINLFIKMFHSRSFLWPVLQINKFNYDLLHIKSSFHTNPLAWRLGQVKIMKEFVWIIFFFFSKYGFQTSRWKKLKQRLKEYWGISYHYHLRLHNNTKMKNSNNSIGPFKFYPIFKCIPVQVHLHPY